MIDVESVMLGNAVMRSWPRIAQSIPGQSVNFAKFPLKFVDPLGAERIFSSLPGVRGNRPTVSARDDCNVGPHRTVAVISNSLLKNPDQLGCRNLRLNHDHPPVYARRIRGSSRRRIVTRGCDETSRSASRRDTDSEPVETGARRNVPQRPPGERRDPVPAARCYRSCRTAAPNRRPAAYGAGVRRDDAHTVFSNSSRPISMRRISLVPAPIS